MFDISADCPFFSFLPHLFWKQGSYFCWYLNITISPTITNSIMALWRTFLQCIFVWRNANKRELNKNIIKCCPLKIHLRMSRKFGQKKYVVFQGLSIEQCIFKTVLVRADLTCRRHCNVYMHMTVRKAWAHRKSVSTCHWGPCVKELPLFIGWSENNFPRAYKHFSRYMLQWGSMSPASVYWTV